MSLNISQAAGTIRKIRVAWFTLSPPSLYGINSSGGWISALRESLLKRNDVNLQFIVLKKPLKLDIGENYKNCHFILTPRKHDGRLWPTEEMIRSFKSTLEIVKPDVLHIWGTEWCGPIMAVLAGQTTPILVNIQGIPYSIIQHLMGTKSILSMIRWAGPHDILARSGLFRYWRAMKRVVEMEKAALKSISFFECSTFFKEAWVRANNPKARIFSRQTLLRPPFYQSNWTLDRADRHSIFLADAFTAYKGFDILLKAAELLVRDYPDLRIRVSGPIPRKGFFKASSFEKYINHLVSTPIMRNRVEFIGPLNACGMAQEMEKAHCVVVSSLIESECQVANEAMAAGAPLVVPFTGGITDLFEHMKSAVGYPVADHQCLAHGIRKIFENDSFARALSRNAKVKTQNRADCNNIVESLVDEYVEIIKDNRKN